MKPIKIFFFLFLFFASIVCRAEGEGRVVFIGNSITAGWIMYHPEFFETNGYIDRGICGEVTEQILARFEADVVALKPELVVIAGGTNDIAEGGDEYSPEATLANFKSMVALARANGIKVVIGSLLPCEKFTWGRKPDNAPAAIEHMNSLLRAYTAEEGIPFADYYPHMVSGPEKALNPDWTVDHIHPTLPGYLVMEGVVKPLIDKELGAAPRSLDDIERESYHAEWSPATLAGTDMQPVKSAKAAQGAKARSLGGEWELTAGETPDWSNAIAAHVPGSVHGALYAAGLIPDPTVGLNDSIAERQSYRHWWMRRRFDYKGCKRPVRLTFGGVANKCTIYLNGKELGRHEGMLSDFSYILDSELKDGDNELLVHLEPIPDTGAGHNPSWTQTVVANCVYGWHYVKIPTLGLWRDVEIAEVPVNEFENPFIFTRSTDGSMRLTVTLPEAKPKAELKLVVKPKNFDGKAQAYSADVSGRTGEVALDFKIDNPQLWWPNGSGEQALYSADIQLSAPGAAPSVKTLQFGIRTIDMEPVGGTPNDSTYNWKFVVNGKPIFAKGTNWCLPDFMMDLSPERYGRFLGAAKEQNLNLLRAWGGGLVETDTFYDMCDSLGLMVMQEWPTAWNSHNFQPLDVLKETVDHNMLRIRSHPSLAMWAGGNESGEPFGEAIDHMGRRAVELDGTRPFHRGEPWGGSSHNHDSWWLDLHLNNALNMSAAFFGEFGMPSLPVRESVDRYLAGEEYRYPLPQGTVFEHHAPTFGAWQDMRLLFREAGWFVEPTSLDNMILGSQLAQTMGTRRAMERARTLWPHSSAGAVYYKINDVYPGLSWGSLDYYGAKKTVHYFVKRSTQHCLPVILFNHTNLTGLPAELDYYLLDDNLDLAGKPVVAQVCVYDHKMNLICQRADTIAPSAQVNVLPQISLTKKQTTTPMLYFKADVRSIDGELLARNWYMENFDSKQNAMFDAPSAEVTVERSGNVITLSNTSATAPAVGVNIEVPGHAATLTLSDNMLWLDPGETVTITANTPEPASVTWWNK